MGKHRPLRRHSNATRGPSIRCTHRRRRSINPNQTNPTPSIDSTPIRQVQTRVRGLPEAEQEAAYKPLHQQYAPEVGAFLLRA